MSASYFFQVIAANKKSWIVMADESSGWDEAKEKVQQAMHGVLPVGGYIIRKGFLLSVLDTDGPYGFFLERSKRIEDCFFFGYIGESLFPMKCGE